MKILLFSIVNFVYLVSFAQAGEGFSQFTKSGYPWCWDSCPHISFPNENYQSQMSFTDVNGNMIEFPSETDWLYWFNSPSLLDYGCGIFRHNHFSKPEQPIMQLAYFLENAMRSLEDSIVERNGKRKYPLIEYIDSVTKWRINESVPLLCTYKTQKNGYIKQESDTLNIRMFVQGGKPQYFENLKTSEGVSKMNLFWTVRLNEDICQCTGWFKHLQVNGNDTFYLYFKTTITYLIQYHYY